MKPLVLVVDDDPDMLILLNDLLTHEGYRVVTAQSGSQAMIALGEQKPQAMVLDIMMADRNGVEVLELIRWNPQYTELPVVCISAMQISSQSREFLENFAQGIVDKAHLEDLLLKLQQLLPAHQ